MVTYPHSIEEQKAFFDPATSIHNKEHLDRKDVITDVISIFQLLKCALEICFGRSYNIDSLCQEIEKLTGGQACLLLHTSSQGLPESTQFSLPVRFEERAYGTLCILDDISRLQTTGLSFALAQLLAQTCGWLLYTLEQTAFLQEQCQQLVYQLNGPLTKRELEVLGLMCRGYDGKAIANKLYISITTVGKHRQHIYEQLGVHNERDACLVAYKTGLYSPFVPNLKPLLTEMSE